MALALVRRQDDHLAFRTKANVREIRFHNLLLIQPNARPLVLRVGVVQVDGNKPNQCPGLAAVGTLDLLETRKTRLLYTQARFKYATLRKSHRCKKRQSGSSMSRKQPVSMYQMAKVCTRSWYSFRPGVVVSDLEGPEGGGEEMSTKPRSPNRNLSLPTANTANVSPPLVYVANWCPGGVNLRSAASSCLQNFSFCFR